MSFADQLADQFDPFSGRYDGDDVTQALSWAQSFIEQYCGRESFDSTTDVVILDPSMGSATLPEIPVVSVSLVEGWLPANGAMQWTTLTNYMVVSKTGLIYDTTGLPGTTWTVGPSWPCLPGSLRVTYTHGFNPIPQALIDTAVRLTQQYLEDPGVVIQERVGEVEQRFAGPKGIALSDFDAAVLGRYTIVNIA